MLSLIGIVVVFGAIVGGFLMEKGKLLVLVQPSELVIIGGAALGTLLIANHMALLMRILKSVPKVLTGSRFTTALYLETLKMLYDVFQFARKNGMARLEEDVENPEQSQVFSNYPNLLKDKHVLHFVCDSLRTAVSGVVAVHDLDLMLETDIEIHHHEIAAPVRALETVADALPGFGIVAAVLGIVITMGALGGLPEGVGEKVAAALIGTFLGILLSYGLVAPVAAALDKICGAETGYYQTLRAGLMSFARGAAPLIAVEFARRTIPHDMRPGFQDMEAACRGSAAAPVAEKAAAA